jgi:hypothetical protein
LLTLSKPEIFPDVPVLQAEEMRSVEAGGEEDEYSASEDEEEEEEEDEERPEDPRARPLATIQSAQSATLAEYPFDILVRMTGVWLRFQDEVNAGVLVASVPWPTIESLAATWKQGLLDASEMDRKAPTWWDILEAEKLRRNEIISNMPGRQ